MGEKGEDASEMATAIPEIDPSCDLTALSLGPDEGFLLSRIDGQTSWGLLRELAGMEPAQVDARLFRWLESGVIRVPGRQIVSYGDGSRARDEHADEIDESLDIPVERQREILEFEACLGRSYHEILGVPRGADTRAIKRAYFGLSKRFHPDQYFRRRVGGYLERVERIFRRVVEAYELLADPATRAECERSMGRSEPKGSDGTRRRRFENPFALLPRIVRERKRKAAQYFDLGQQALAEEYFADAAAHLRLAIAYDPWNDSYKGPFLEAQKIANEERADRLLKEAASAYDLGHYEPALSAYEEALHLRPYHADANHRAALLAWKVSGDLRRAKEYAARACEVEPESVSYRKTLARIYATAGLLANARREFEQILEHAPGDAETRVELKDLKRRAGGGGLFGGGV